MSEIPPKTGLKAVDLDVVREDLSMPAPKELRVVEAEETELSLKADQFIATLFDCRDESVEREQSKASVEAMGLDLQREAAACSEKLKDPVSKLAQRGAEGGEVANALVQLRDQVEALDPPRFDVKRGFLTRLLGYIPRVGSPLKRYFTRYESAQVVIDGIIRSLELGRDQLKHDSSMLSEDRARLQDVSEQLVKTIKLAQIVDSKLQAKLDTELVAGSDDYIFVSEGLVFPIRQRVMDLQQQLVVAQQATLAIEIVIRNNKELVRGVNRALQVTIGALQVAVTVALALADQKIVLDKVHALNSTTSNLISKTAELLKTQGTAIQKTASGTMLDMNALRTAFADIRIALEDLSKFRQEALPIMSAQIKELDTLSQESAALIEMRERSNRAELALAVERA